MVSPDVSCAPEAVAYSAIVVVAACSNPLLLPKAESISFALLDGAVDEGDYPQIPRIITHFTVLSSRVRILIVIRLFRCSEPVNTGRLAALPF